MAHIELEAAGVTVHMSPLDEILALHGSLHLPYSHIRAVGADPVPHYVLPGFRIGTDVPGIKLAGTFFTAEGVMFYDYHDRTHCLTFQIDHQHYQRVIVQVDRDQDPEALAAQITARLRRPP